MKSSLRKILSSKWLAIVGIVLAVACVAGGVALQVTRNAAADRKDQEYLRTDSTVEDDSTKPLKIGSVAKIGLDYSVAVTKVTLHEGTGTPFLVAIVKTKNSGEDTVRPQADLKVGFSKKGWPRSNESTCSIDLGKLNVTGKPLAVGDVQTYGVCINLPSNELKDGKVSILESSTGSRAAWTTDGPVAKVVTTIAPEIHNDAPLGPSPADTAKSLKKLEKQIKKAKKARDKLDKQIDKAEDAGVKGKDMKKLKKAEDKLDDAIDDMEDIRDKLRAAG
jgi:hypothetical protein